MNYNQIGNKNKVKKAIKRHITSTRIIFVFYYSIFSIEINPCLDHIYLNYIHSFSNVLDRRGKQCNSHLLESGHGRHRQCHLVFYSHDHCLLCIYKIPFYCILFSYCGHLKLIFLNLQTSISGTGSAVTATFSSATTSSAPTLSQTIGGSSGIYCFTTNCNAVNYKSASTSVVPSVFVMATFLVASLF